MLSLLMFKSWAYYSNIISYYGFIYFLANYINPVLFFIFMFVGVVYFIRHMR